MGHILKKYKVDNWQHLADVLARIPHSPPQHHEEDESTAEDENVEEIGVGDEDVPVRAHIVR